MNEPAVEVKVSKKKQLVAANEQIEKLQKELESMISLKETYSKRASEYEAELEQLHQFLDAAPSAPPREKEGSESWHRVNLSVMTRLSVWIATNRP